MITLRQFRIAHFINGVCYASQKRTKYTTDNFVTTTLLSGQCEDHARMVKRPAFDGTTRTVTWSISLGGIQ